MALIPESIPVIGYSYFTIIATFRSANLSNYMKLYRDWFQP